MTSCSSAGVVPETADSYLQKHELSYYMKDCWKQMLTVETPSPRLAMAHYFTTLQDGTNIVGREFAYVSATHRNRLAFIRRIHYTFWATYQDVDLTIRDFCYLSTSLTNATKIMLVSVLFILFV